LLLVVAGYLIGVRQRLGLLAGYDPKRVRDPTGLAHWTGGGAALLGLWTLTAAVVLPLFPKQQAVCMSIYLLGVLLGVGAMILGSRRFSA
jgi:hypothetical protein